MQKNATRLLCLFPQPRIALAARLAALCLLAGFALRTVHAQDAEPWVPNSKHDVQSEITIESEASYGNWQVFATGYGSKLYTSGVEYDRHSWGRLLWARADYVAEALPVVLLDEPAKLDSYGNPLTKQKQIVPGIGFSPIGIRLMWANERRFKPYYTLKGGMLFFPRKVLSPDTSYGNLSMEMGVGLQARLTPRIGVRLGLFNDFHFSDAFVVGRNPGLDVMNSNLGLTYQLGHRPAQ